MTAQARESPDAQGSEALQALQAVLAGEHAAIWAYGVVGARLTQDRRPEAFTALQDHRAARDVLQSLVRTSHGDPVPAEASYELPMPVTTPTEAATLAATVEDRLAALYADLIIATPEFRRFAITSLRQVAVRSSQWSDTSIAFPGLPERA